MFKLESKGILNDFMSLNDEERIFLLYDIIDDDRHIFKAYEGILKGIIAKRFMELCRVHSFSDEFIKLPNHYKEDILSTALEKFTKEVLSYCGKLAYKPGELSFFGYSYLKMSYAKGIVIGFYTNMTEQAKKDYLTVRRIYSGLLINANEDCSEEELFSAVIKESKWGIKRVKRAVHNFLLRNVSSMHLDFSGKEKLIKTKDYLNGFNTNEISGFESEFINSLSSLSFNEFYEIVSCAINYESAYIFWLNQVENYQRMDLSVMTIREKCHMKENVEFIKALNRLQSTRGGRLLKMNKTETGEEVVAVDTLQRKLNDIKKAILSNEKVAMALYKRLTEGLS